MLVHPTESDMDMEDTSTVTLLVGTHSVQVIKCKTNEAFEKLKNEPGTTNLYEVYLPHKEALVDRQQQKVETLKVRCHKCGIRGHDKHECTNVCKKELQELTSQYNVYAEIERVKSLNDFVKQLEETCRMIPKIPGEEARSPFEELFKKLKGFTNIY